MNSELRQECIEVIREILGYFETGLEAYGVIGETAAVQRAERLLKELERP